MKTKQPDWEKEFKKKFVRPDGLMDKYGEDDNGDQDFLANIIIDFIRQLLKDERKRLTEEIEEILKKRGFQLRLNGTAEVYNEAVSKCIDLVVSLKGKK